MGWPDYTFFFGCTPNIFIFFTGLHLAILFMLIFSQHITLLILNAVNFFEKYCYGFCSQLDRLIHSSEIFKIGQKIFFFSACPIRQMTVIVSSLSSNFNLKTQLKFVNFRYSSIWHQATTQTCCNTWLCRCSRGRQRQETGAAQDANSSNASCSTSGCISIAGKLMETC